MPNVLSLGGYTFWMVKSDPPPPHVTVLNERGIVRLALGDDEQDVYVLGRFGFDDWEIARISIILRAKREQLLREWEALHESRSS
jgi:hypothetical protein